MGWHGAIKIFWSILSTKKQILNYFKIDALFRLLIASRQQ